MRWMGRLVSGLLLGVVVAASLGAVDPAPAASPATDSRRAAAQHHPHHHRRPAAVRPERHAADAPAPRAGGHPVHHGTLTPPGVLPGAGRDPDRAVRPEQRRPVHRRDQRRLPGAPLAARHDRPLAAGRGLPHGPGRQVPAEVLLGPRRHPARLGLVGPDDRRRPLLHELHPGQQRRARSPSPTATSPTTSPTRSGTSSTRGRPATSRSSSGSRSSLRTRRSCRATAGCRDRPSRRRSTPAPARASPTSPCRRRRSTRPTSATSRAGSSGRPLYGQAGLDRLQAVFEGRQEALQSVDDAVAGLVQHLDDLGELDNTLIIFTSDNGFLLGEHRYLGKLFGYEEALRVPFLMRGPGIAPRQVSDRVVTTTDIAPTILEAAGATPGRRVDGQSFLHAGSADTYAGGAGRPDPGGQQEPGQGRPAGLVVPRGQGRPLHLRALVRRLRGALRPQARPVPAHQHRRRPGVPAGAAHAAPDHEHPAVVPRATRVQPPGRPAPGPELIGPG